jgi:hypothetical protein
MPQITDIVNMAIQPIVCQKSEFHINSDFRNSQKLDLLQIPAKNFCPKYGSLSKIFWCKKLTHGALQK